MKASTPKQIRAAIPFSEIDHVQLNIYLHRRLQQYDPEVKIDTVTSKKLVYDRNLSETYTFTTYYLEAEPYFQEIDSLITERMNGL